MAKDMDKRIVIAKQAALELKDGNYVKVNAEQNSVVLSAPREVLAKFREDIAQFDIPAAQILIELQLIELTDTSLDQLGLNFNYNNSGRSYFLDLSYKFGK